MSVEELEAIESFIEETEEKLRNLKIESEDDYDYRQDLLADLRNARHEAKQVEALINNPYQGWE